MIGMTTGCIRVEAMRRLGRPIGGFRRWLHLAIFGPRSLRRLLSRVIMMEGFFDRCIEGEKFCSVLVFLADARSGWHGLPWRGEGEFFREREQSFSSPLRRACSARHVSPLQGQVKARLPGHTKILDANQRPTVLGIRMSSDCQPLPL